MVVNFFICKAIWGLFAVLYQARETFPFLLKGILTKLKSNGKSFSPYVSND